MVEEAVTPVKQRTEGLSLKGGLGNIFFKIRLSEMHFPELWGWKFVNFLCPHFANKSCEYFTELLPILAQSDFMKNKIITYNYCNCSQP